MLRKSSGLSVLILLPLALAGCGGGAGSSASRITLTQTPDRTYMVGAPVAASFTLEDPAKPASVQNKTVALAWSGTGAFSGPPASATTDATGAFTLDLTGQTAGAVTLTATLPDGRAAFMTLTVDLLTIALANGTPNPAVDGTSTITAAVMVNGVAAPSRSVAWTWKTKGGSQAPQAGGSSSTDANGETTYTQGNVGFAASAEPRRTVTVTATADGVSQSVDVQFGAALPDGFIVLSPMRNMNWSSAKSYCVNLGGTLPRVNHSDSTSVSSPIDGFGNPGSQWPAELPADQSYWTGTHNAYFPLPDYYVFGISCNADGQVMIHNIYSIESTRITTVCVP